MADCWQATTGPHGATVTVEERKLGGNVYIKCYDSDLGGYRKRSLGFPVRDDDGTLIEEAVQRAKQAANDLSNRRLEGKGMTNTVTLGQLVRLFRREEIPDMAEKHAQATKRQTRCLKNFLGSDFPVEDLGVREWNALKRKRKSGEIDARGRTVKREADQREVSDTTVGKTLKALRQLCRFGTRYRTQDGFLLDLDPTHGFEIPKTSNPKRPICDDARYEAMLEAAPDVHPYMAQLLRLAAGTGRRIGAIVAVQHRDWFPDRGENGALRWRADTDKLDQESTVPVTSTVRETVEEIREERPGVGKAWLFPAPRSSGHLNPSTAINWWRETEDEAELEHETGMGWHSLRRMWATKRKHLPLQDVAAAGGWKGTQVLSEIYQQADVETLEAVVNNDRRIQRREA